MATTQDVKHLARAETWGMTEIRDRLAESGTGPTKLADLDRKIAERGSDPLAPSTAAEWQAAATGAQRAVDFVVQEHVVTRRKASEFVRAIVSRSRAMSQNAALAGETCERAASHRGGGLAGIVKRLGAAENCVGTGALYRWMGWADKLRIGPDGPDQIALVSGDVALQGDMLVGIADQVGVLEIQRAGSADRFTVSVGGASGGGEVVGKRTAGVPWSEPSARARDLKAEAVDGDGEISDAELERLTAPDAGGQAAGAGQGGDQAGSESTGGEDATGGTQAAQDAKGE